MTSMRRFALFHVRYDNGSCFETKPHSGDENGKYLLERSEES